MYCGWGQNTGTCAFDRKRHDRKDKLKLARDWEYKILCSLREKMPEKFWDGTYIAHRIILNEFTEEDMNLNFYYVKDALPGKLSCVYADSGKKYRLSAGELTTITMIEDLREGCGSCVDILKVLLMAYFHDLDSILIRWLPGKSIGKIHRQMTNMNKTWLRSYKDTGICYWRKNHKKYLPLDSSALDKIEEEIRLWSEEQRMETFDSENMNMLTDHICYVLQLAFDTKILSLQEFSEEACIRAADKILEMTSES